MNRVGSSKFLLDILNQIFEIERKSKDVEGLSIERNVEKIKRLFEESIEGYSLSYHNPMHEKFDETRTDCEASISGMGTENLVIVDVIKPIIRLKQDGVSHIAQKGVVIVESIKTN